MKHSFWPGGDYPIYINPTDKELLELSQTLWDTIRICIDDEAEVLAIASGYGNTHASVCQSMKAVLKRKRLNPATAILYHNHQQFFFNMEDLGGNEAEPAEQVLREDFLPEHAQMLRTLIQFREQLF